MNPNTAAEAAVWVARLHGPERSPELERQFQAWLAASADNRHAFERCTEMWMLVPQAPMAQAFVPSRPVRPARRRRAWVAWAPPVMLVITLLGLVLWPAGELYVTQLGEYRLVVLDDGSQLRLNTSTRLRVSMGRQRRVVELQSGEAHFEVARDATRPFVVLAAGHEVRALGTVFTVRLNPEPTAPLTVTLVEGKVEVRPTKSASALSSALPLQPGQRLRLFGTDPAPKVDQPPLQVVTSWVRQEIELVDLPLAEAVAEVNRYSRVPIVLADDARLSSRRVSGVYRTGDSAGFAAALTSLHGLELVPQADRLLIQVRVRAAADRSNDADLRHTRP